MPKPYEEYTLFENILGMSLLYLTTLLGYFVLKQLLVKSQERRSESIEEGADASDEEYWRED